jgi:hypothetical protein
MEKDFVPYELALRLKELGFDELCFGEYTKTEYINPSIILNDDGYEIKADNSDIKTIKAPALTFSQAFRWFRDKHGLHGEPIWDNVEKTYWFFSITEIGNVDFVEGRHRYETPLTEDQDFNDGYPVVLKWRQSFEEAELACLEKLIEIVEQKQNKNEEI